MSRKYTNNRLKIASNQITRDFDNFAKQYDMTWMHMSIIDFLSHRADKETFQSDIEREFFIQRSTTTVLLQRMEKRELIYRKPSATDARQKSVYLTAKAHSLEQQIDGFMHQRQDVLEENFSESEIATFEKILNFYINQGEH